MLARLSCDHFQPGLQRQLLWLCAPDEPLDHARFIQVMNIYIYIYVDQGKTDDGQFTWIIYPSIYHSLSLSLSVHSYDSYVYIYIIYSTRIYFRALDFL